MYLIFFFKVPQSTEFGYIFHLFSQNGENTQSDKFGAFPTLLFFKSIFGDGSVAEGNTTFFFLGLLI